MQTRPSKLLRPAWPLAACVAVMLLWPASEFWTGWVGVAVGSRVVFADVGPGWFTVMVRPRPSFSHNPMGRMRSSWQAMHVQWLDPDTRQLLSANSAVYSNPGSYRFYCPLWLVTASTGLLGGGLIVSRWRRVARDRPGHCPRCGYDLRATPERCPECGTVSVHAGL